MSKAQTSLTAETIGLPSDQNASGRSFGEEEIALISDVIRSGTLFSVSGAVVKNLEKRFAKVLGVKYAYACASGTAAVHTAVAAINPEPGDEIITSPITDMGAIAPILYQGAIPVFADVDPETYNISAETIEPRLSQRTRAIIVTHLFGNPCDMHAIMKLGEKYGVPVIEDCAQSFLAMCDGKYAGTIGKIGAFSFQQGKQMTTGEGGIVVTDDDETARFCRSLANQGRGEMGAWLEHDRLGYNYRLDEMSAALGTSQLRRIEEFLAKRERVARRYSYALARFDWVRPPLVKPDVRMSWFVYVVTLAEGLDRDEVMRRMEARGVPVRGYFSPVHLQPYIRERFGYAGGELPVTESVARRTIALPFHNNLSDAEVEEVVATLADVVEKG